MEIFNIIQKTILALKSGFHKKILPSCNICKFKTNERKLLVIHMDTHHGQFEQLQTAINRIIRARAKRTLKGQIELDIEREIDRYGSLIFNQNSKSC